MCTWLFLDVEFVRLPPCAAQVVAYLAPDDAEPYFSREAWEAKHLQVVDAIERVAR